MCCPNSIPNVGFATMPDDLITKINKMTIPMQQVRYMQLARKVTDLAILTVEELAELKALREALQQTAQQRSADSRFR